MRSLLRAVALLSAVALIAAAPLSSPAPSRAVNPAAVRTIMNTSHIPGLELVVLDHGKVAYSGAFGVKNLTTKAPVDQHTRFEIGSITKQFTAAAVMQLADSGKLSLSDPLGKYVKNLPAAKKVTIRQLLWQVSGIPNYTDVNGFEKLAVSRPGTFDAMMALVAKMPLHFKPGTKWEYSNTNYVLLGRIVELASGMPWAQYIRTHVFAPAGMTESSFMEDESHIADMATGYTMEKGKIVPTQPFVGWAAAAGAIVSTASDLGKWDNAFFSGRIVPMRDVKEITTPGPVKGSFGGYGFGWFIDTQNGVARISHDGGTFGYLASNETYPSLSQAIIVLQNSTTLAPDKVGEVAFDDLHPELATTAGKTVGGEDPAITARVKAVWNEFTSGKLDRAQFSDQLNKVLTPDAVAGASAQMKALGAPSSWSYAGSQKSGQLTAYNYRVAFANGISMTVTMALTPDGKIDGYLMH
jgi:CubicO group peptidase (beta-lactamase class C family)